MINKISSQRDSAEKHAAKRYQTAAKVASKYRLYLTHLERMLEALHEFGSTLRSPDSSP